VVDALGYPVRLHFTGGNINDCKVAEDVLSSVDISGSCVMGDKAYGTKAIRDYITSRGATPYRQRQILLSLGSVIGGSTKNDIWLNPFSTNLNNLGEWLLDMTNPLSISSLLLFSLPS
jgi:transposase